MIKHGKPLLRCDRRTDISYWKYINIGESLEFPKQLAKINIVPFPSYSFSMFPSNLSGTSEVPCRKGNFVQIFLVILKHSFLLMQSMYSLKVVYKKHFSNYYSRAHWISQIILVLQLTAKKVFEYILKDLSGNTNLWHPTSENFFPAPATTVEDQRQVYTSKMKNREVTSLSTVRWNIFDS